MAFIVKGNYSIAKVSLLQSTQKQLKGDRLIFSPQNKRDKITPHQEGNTGCLETPLPVLFSPSRFIIIPA